MSALDSLITIFLLATAFSGWRRGIFREILVSSLWVPTLFGIGFVITHSVTVEGELDTQNLSLLWTIASLYLMGVIVIWGIDLAFVQPRFKGALQGSARHLYKFTGMILALLRSWYILMAGLALYITYVDTLDDDLARHGLYLPHLVEPATDLSDWLQNEDYIQHEHVEYTDEVYTYQSEVDRTKGLLKDSFLNRYSDTPAEEDPE